MTASLVLPAPAKLNRFLHITGRRSDGYHELQTAFQFLDYADEIQLTVREDGQIRRITDVAGVAVEDDLTVRAGRLLKSVSEVPLGADIRIRKRIPTGAGLGGGSSDAATALVGLNRLWGVGLSQAELAELGLRLGADVPVFIFGSAAWAEGVGQILTRLDIEECWYLIVYPGCHVSTARVFSAPDLTRDSPPLKIRDLFPGPRGNQSPFDLLKRGRNDCETVVRQRYPQVDAALRWLSGEGPARMTGTGAAVFTPLADQCAGHASLARVPDGWQGILARGLNRSPLYVAAASSEGVA